MTASARAVATCRLNERLLARIDPNNALSEEERAARLVLARKAYYRGLARLSAIKRGRASEGQSARRPKGD